VSTPDDVAVAAGHSVDPAGWRVLFDELMCLVAGRFGWAEPRRTAREFVLGLLSPAERKNCWQLAEQAGHGDPQAMQRLLRTAAWDADAVRDDVRGFVSAQLGDVAGVLIPDETGFVKKGTGSVGVQRQYSGTAGRIENSQVGVFLSYACPRGRALIDRRVYLPKSWADDRCRCAAAGVPLRADQIAAALPAGAWHRISAGTGAKGPRWYDWAWAGAHQPGHSLLIRRGSSGELAFYRCWSPAPVPLTALVHVAGMRWAVEEGFQAANACALHCGSVPSWFLE
jgi:SRSO17 transposase